MGENVVVGTCQYCQEEQIQLARHEGKWLCPTCIHRDKLNQISEANNNRKKEIDRLYRRAINTP